MPRRNLAMGLLQKLLKGELEIRRRKNAVFIPNLLKMKWWAIQDLNL